MSNDGEWLAHSKGHDGRTQSMREHASEVRRRALDRAPEFLRNEVEWATVLHDLGKYAPVFQDRLRGLGKGLDHWSSGAFALCGTSKTFPVSAVAVHAHHVGLGFWGASPVRGEDGEIRATGTSCSTLTRVQVADALRFVREEVGLPSRCPSRFLRGEVGSMLDARMVLSALVDADHSDTARHFTGEERLSPPPLDARAALATLEAFVASRAASLEGRADPDILRVRADLARAAHEAAEGPRGVYELEAPTGAGKTLAMLAFALRHRVAHPELRRIVMVLPYLSILDQATAVIREALGPHAQGLLEHHSLAEWRTPRKSDGEAGEGDAERRAMEMLAEDWNAPIVVTTSVQFFDSLFADHPGRVRKLCSLADAVILLDEVQTLPPSLQSATVRALARLAHEDYGASVVVSTATQPLWSRFAPAVAGDGDGALWSPTPIAPASLGLFARSRRYEIEWDLKVPKRPDEVADLLMAAEGGRALCIVNTKRDAAALAELINAREVPVLHLSTAMCPAHRREVLARFEVSDPDAPCLLVATQCVEAGVDLDFPLVLRALAPLEAVAQAAGRCNRAGRGEGRVVVFRPEDERFPTDEYGRGAAQTRTMVAEDPRLDPQDPSVFARYFAALARLAERDGTTKALEDAIATKDFPKVAELYRLIPARDVVRVLVPYPAQDFADESLPVAPTRDWYQNATPFLVEARRGQLERGGFAEPLFPHLGRETGLYRALYGCYDELVGLRADAELGASRLIV